MNTISKKIIETPLGNIYTLASSKGIILLSFGKPKEFNEYSKEKNQHIEQLETELDEYFQGKRKFFDVALNIVGTDFQKKAWQALRKIPYGKTISYKDQAIKIGKEEAIRAVGSANGKNKLVILIPCHRVIKSNGDLGGFSAGIYRKEWLLNHERRFNKLP